MRRCYYDTRVAVLARVHEMALRDFERSVPADTTNVVQLIEMALANNNIDRARVFAWHFQHGRPPSDSGVKCDMTAQIDAMAVRQMLKHENERAHMFACTVLPTAENLLVRIAMRNDKEARLLLSMGAPIPAAAALCDLFAAHNMPRTINYMLDHDMIPFAELGVEHFDACINTPNVRLVRLLVEHSPAIRAHVAALDCASLYKVRVVHFYWSVRLFSLLDRDAESIRSFKHHVDTTRFSPADILLLLRAGGDCLQELSDEAAVQNWNKIDATHDPYALFRPLRTLVERHIEPKIDHVRFFFEALTTLRTVADNEEKFNSLIQAVSLPVNSQPLAEWTSLSALPLFLPSLLNYAAA